LQSALCACIAGCDDALDAIVSADTLVYFGPLDAVVASSETALRPRGRLVFTVEELDGAEYSLAPSGRYRHAREYVEAVLTDAGLRPEIVSAELRLEAGPTVGGLL